MPPRDDEPPPDAGHGAFDGWRRELMRQAACVAGAWAASTALPAVAGAAEAHPRSRLVDAVGDPFKASRLRVGEAHLFNYPFAASPVFLLRLAREVHGTELLTESRQAYASPGGVGPGRSIVAFSAICSHKLMYPTPSISFIGLRKGLAGEPAQVIHCCGDQSRYDPAQGARVMAGPAPQPLAAVLLEWDERSDELDAVGVRGGAMFKAFFDKYAFRLQTELGARALAPAAATCVVQPADRYSRQWQSCRA